MHIKHCTNHLLFLDQIEKVTNYDNNYYVYNNPALVYYQSRYEDDTRYITIHDYFKKEFKIDTQVDKIKITLIDTSNNERIFYS